MTTNRKYSIPEALKKIEEDAGIKMCLVTLRSRIRQGWLRTIDVTPEGSKTRIKLITQKALDDFIQMIKSIERESWVNLDDVEQWIQRERKYRRMNETPIKSILSFLYSIQKNK